MALKKIGRAEWLGVNGGGMGYFAKYCPHCREKVYLVEDELEEFLLAVYTPRLWQLAKHYLKLRIRLPRLCFKVVWENPRELEVVKLNERIEVSRNENLKLLNPKNFSRNFFNEKYSLRGGILQLEKMIKEKSTPSQIGEWFGFSRQRAFDILQSYDAKKIAN